MYTSAELILLPISLLVMVGIAFLLRLLLKDKSEKLQSIPFIVITILLWAGEIAKQILDITSEDGYSYWTIPLHFCNTYFIWFALAEFTTGKLRRHMQSIAFVMTLYLFVGFYVYPRFIIGDACEHVFLTFSDAHTFFFHHLVILYSILTIVFGRFHPTKKDLIIFPICMAGYFATAVTFAHLLDTNYFNLLESLVPLMEAIRVNAGQVVYTLFFGTAMVSLGTILLFVCLKVKAKMEKQDAEESVEPIVEMDEAEPLKTVE